MCLLCVCAAPLCAVGLAPAGHRVADARAGARVHVLHHDEGMLLQRRHGQVPVVRHLLQEAAVPGPDGVPDLEDPPRVCAHLETRGGGGGEELMDMSTPSVFTCFVLNYSRC